MDELAATDIGSSVRAVASHAAASFRDFALVIYVPVLPVADGRGIPGLHQWFQPRPVGRPSDRENDRRVERGGVCVQQASSLPGWSLESLPEVLDARVFHGVPARKT